METCAWIADAVRVAKKAQHPRHFIRQWRNYRGLTLEALASRVGTTHASLSRIERGLQPYSQPLLEAIAEALNCMPADLIIRDPLNPNPFWTLWDSISPAERPTAARVLEAFIKKTGTADK
jgi:transcriptional regulator with XRE-family HTH domain